MGQTRAETQPPHPWPLGTGCPKGLSWPVLPAPRPCPELMDLHLPEDGGVEGGGRRGAGADSVSPIGARGLGQPQGRKESPNCPRAQLWEVTPHGHQASGQSVTGLGPRMQIRPGSRPGTQPVFGEHGRRGGTHNPGPRWWDPPPTNPEPSLGAVRQFTGSTRHLKSECAGFMIPKAGVLPKQERVRGRSLHSGGAF